MNGAGEPSRDGQKRIARRDAIVTGLIGPVFLALAAWFVFGPSLASLPETEPVSVARDLVDADPPRQAITGTPTIVAGGFDLRCSECHRLFPPRTDARRTLGQHRHIELDHGVNDLCLNCHDAQNRNMLRLAGGETVPFAEAPRLCGSCHGLAYRDWERGMHGRTNGYWNPSLGQQHRLICTECHDPHAPAFAPMRPLPGPRTLRTSRPEGAHESAAPHAPSPLRTWGAGGGSHSDAHSPPNPEEKDDAHDDDSHGEGGH